MAQRLFTSSTRSTAAKQKEERRGGVGGARGAGGVGGAGAGAAVQRREKMRDSLEMLGVQKSLQEIHKQKVNMTA